MSGLGLSSTLSSTNAPPEVLSADEHPIINEIHMNFAKIELAGVLLVPSVSSARRALQELDDLLHRCAASRSQLSKAAVQAQVASSFREYAAQ